MKELNGLVAIATRLAKPLNTLTHLVFHLQTNGPRTSVVRASRLSRRMTIRYKTSTQSDVVITACYF